MGFSIVLTSIGYSIFSSDSELRIALIKKLNSDNSNAENNRQKSQVMESGRNDKIVKDILSLALNITGSCNGRAYKNNTVFRWTVCSVLFVRDMGTIRPRSAHPGIAAREVWQQSSGAPPDCQASAPNYASPSHSAPRQHRESLPRRLNDLVATWGLSD